MIRFLPVLLLVAFSCHADDARLLLPPGITPPMMAEAADLIANLERISDQSFQVGAVDGVFDYLDAARLSAFALVIAPPHVAGWLLRNNKATALVSERGSPSYMVLVDGDDDRFYQLRDLAGKKLCGLSPPDFYLSHLVRLVNNPYREPIGIPVADRDSRLRRLNAGQCDAALIDADSYSLLDDSANEVRIIFQSKDLPGLTVLANKEMDAGQATAIQLWLLGPDAAQSTAWLSKAGWVQAAPKKLRRFSDLIEDQLPMDLN